MVDKGNEEVQKILWAELDKSQQDKVFSDLETEASGGPERFLSQIALLQKYHQVDLANSIANKVFPEEDKFDILNDQDHADCFYTDVLPGISPDVGFPHRTFADYDLTLRNRYIDYQRNQVYLSNV